MKTLLALLLLIPSLSWGSIKLVCQGHSMVQIGYPENSGQTYFEARYEELASVTINEKEDFILVRGALEGPLAYRFQTWRDMEDAFYGIAQNQDGRTVGYIGIDRVSGAMTIMRYYPNEFEKQSLREFYYDCKKATKKF